MYYIRWVVFGVMLGVSFCSVADDYDEGLLHKENGRPARATLLFYKAIALDNDKAMMELGKAFVKANNFDVLEGATRLFGRAAYLGNADAQAYLGVICGLELGACENYKTYPWAYSWYLVAGDEVIKKHAGFIEHRKKLVAKMSKEELIEGEKLAAEFQELISRRQQNIAASIGVYTLDEIEYPLSWRRYFTWANLFLRKVDPSEFSKQRKMLEKELDNEDIAYEKRQRQGILAKNLRESGNRPSNISEAWLLQDGIADLTEIMFSPLIKPDSRIYGAKLVLDSVDKSDALRFRWDLDSFESVWSSPLEERTQDGLARGAIRLSELRAKYGGSVFYAQLNRSKKTITYSDNLRIGNSVWVIGRYVANKKYKKVNRTEGTMPVLEVLYISE